MTRNHAAQLIVSFSGPVASIKHCALCERPVEGVTKFTFRKNRGGGRGAGLGWGAGVTSVLSKHIREAHPEAVEAIAQPLPFFACKNENTRSEAHRLATLAGRDLQRVTNVRHSLSWVDDGKRTGYTLERIR